MTRQKWIILTSRFSRSFLLKWFKLNLPAWVWERSGANSGDMLGTRHGSWYLEVPVNCNHNEPIDITLIIIRNVPKVGDVFYCFGHTSLENYQIPQMIPACGMLIAVQLFWWKQNTNHQLEIGRNNNSYLFLFWRCTSCRHVSWYLSFFPN